MVKDSNMNQYCSVVQRNQCSKLLNIYTLLRNLIERKSPIVTTLDSMSVALACTFSVILLHFILTVA